MVIKFLAHLFYVLPLLPNCNYLVTILSHLMRGRSGIFFIDLKIHPTSRIRNIDELAKQLIHIYSTWKRTKSGTKIPTMDRFHVV